MRDYFHDDKDLVAAHATSGSAERKELSDYSFTFERGEPPTSESEAWNRLLSCECLCIDVLVTSTATTLFLALVMSPTVSM